MVTFFRATQASLEPKWREVREFWRYDSERRRHKVHVEDVRRAVILDQCQLWVAWDDNPVWYKQKRWQGAHCLGLIVTCLADPDTLVIQFAAGLDLHRWLPIAIPRLELFARACGADKLEVYSRRGWKQELGGVWKSYPSGAVSFRRDPERFRLYPSPIAKGA